MSANLPWSFPEEAVGVAPAEQLALCFLSLWAGQAEDLAGVSNLWPAGSTRLRMAVVAA